MFLKKIASRLIPKPAAAGPRARLAAFGKHPGWNDHIDDLGLDSDLLVAAKRIIYIEGAGGNIDSGAWERLDDESRLAGFDHVLVWLMGGARELFVARLWSSSDGKGRTKYPMVACAQITDVPLDWALDNALPLLDRAREHCASTTSAEAVRAEFDSARAQLVSAAAGAPTAPHAQPDPDAGLAHAREAMLDMGTDPVGLQRILYQIEREMGSYRRMAGGGGGRTRSVDLRPQHLRLPRAPGPASRAIAHWAAFLTSQLDPGAPLMFIVPIGSAWLDVVVGEPGTPQLFCMRATRKALPLTTEIPYTMDAEFLARTGPLVGGRVG